MYMTPHYGNDEKEGGIRLPEGYDGTMLLPDEAGPPEPPEKPPIAARPKGEPQNVKFSPPDEPAFRPPPPPPPPPQEEKRGGAFDRIGALFGRIPALSGIGDLFGKGENRPLRIGTEELLLIGIAAFLFFSDGGDKICAIFLLILLFIA